MFLDRSFRSLQMIFFDKPLTLPSINLDNVHGVFVMVKRQPHQVQEVRHHLYRLGILRPKWLNGLQIQSTHATNQTVGPIKEQSFFKALESNKFCLVMWFGHFSYPKSARSIKKASPHRVMLYQILIESYFGLNCCYLGRQKQSVNGNVTCANHGGRNIMELYQQDSQMAWEAVAVSPIRMALYVWKWIL